MFLVDEGNEREEIQSTNIKQTLSLVLLLMHLLIS
jgi:hypothetical protein